MTIRNMNLRRSGDARVLAAAVFPHVGECLGNAGWRVAPGMQQRTKYAAMVSAREAATT